MTFYSRSDRIGLKIQKAITDLLQKKIQDPRLEMVTISAVEMSPDLRVAHVYVTTYAKEITKTQVLEGCKRSSGFIRKRIAPGLGLKYMPELRFVYDDSFDKAARMDALINSVITPSTEESEDEWNHDDQDRNHHDKG